MSTEPSRENTLRGLVQFWDISDKSVVYFGQTNDADEKWYSVENEAKVRVFLGDFPGFTY